jgi:hypothetical protein
MNLEKLASLGKPVRLLLGGRMMTGFLIDYDESSDSYNGIAFSVGKSIDVSDPQPIERTFRGARKYPYAERPNYAFQFVFPGEDEQPLLNIAQGNINPEHGEGSGGNVPVEGIDTSTGKEEFDPTKDYNQDGVVDKRDKKWFDKNTG